MHGMCGTSTRGEVHGRISYWGRTETSPGVAAPRFRKLRPLSAAMRVEQERIDWMLRARLLVAAMALALVWTSWLGVATARAGPARQVRVPLDLAALAIYPQDAGTDGYVLVDGRSCLTAAACASPVFFGAATEASLSQMKLTRAYALALAQFSTDGRSTVIRSLATTIAEYQTPGGAGEGLKTFLAWLADPASEVPVTADFGSGAQMFDVKGGLAGDANAKEVVGLRFRSGSIVAGIEVRDYTGKAPSRSTVEKLAKTVQARIKAGQGQPELGTLVVHHRPASTEFYSHRSGTTVPLFQENHDQFQARSLEFANAGIEDVYLSNQTLATGSNDQSIDVLLSVALYRLPSASAASDYLNNASNSFAQSRERSGAPTQEPADPPAVGDESVWYLNVFSDAYQAMGYVRTGNIVARVIWQRTHAAVAGEEQTLLMKAEQELLPGAAYSAQSQIGCIQNSGCPGLTKLSSSLLP